MSNLFRRQATELKNLALKTVVSVQKAFATARDLLRLRESHSVGPSAAHATRHGARVREPRSALQGLAGFALMLGAVSSAQAAGALCSDYDNVGTQQNPSYVVDGSKPSVYAQVKANSTFGIDADCAIKNFPQSIGGFPITNINFNFPQHQDFVIVFDNVYYSGGMSCNDPTFSDFWMWWTNGSYNNIDPKCQAFMLPVDAIKKQNPVGQATAAIGVPFKYTLTMPVMMLLTAGGYEYQIPVTDESALADVHLYDDLTKTGADLEYVGNTAYLKNADGSTTALGSLQNLGTSTNLHFFYPNIAAGAQLVVELEVVLLDSNTIGTTFFNTATWTFDKTINGIFKDNLPGQNGISESMTIVGPDLVVDKSSTVTNLNLNGTAPFTVNVQNIGGYDAWNATITDVLPTGMCGTSPLSTLSAQKLTADGTTSITLVKDTDYTATYSGCTLSVTLKDTAAARLGPSEHFVLKYDARFDPASAPSGTYTNVAGATRWFNDASTNATRLQYDNQLTNGTPGTSDFQDAYTITAAAQGYYFLKSVANLSTGASPAATAAPGNILRYTLQIQNFTLPRLSGISITDDLGALGGAAAILPGSLTLAGSDLPAGTQLSVNPAGGTGGAGSITITGLTLDSNTQYQVQFDVTLAAPPSVPFDLLNQASLTGIDEFGVTHSGVSDDPYVGVPALLGPNGDPTRIRVQSPQPPAKAIAPAKNEATIGETVTYRITVPGAPFADPLGGVVASDTLDPSLLFVNATATLNGVPLTLTTGQSGQALSWNLGTIPAGQQAVITVTARVANSGTTDAGDTFTNAASYTYTGAAAPLVGSPTAAITIVEPSVSVSKLVSPTTQPTAGDVLTYTVNLAAATGANYSGAFDTGVVDTLSLGLGYVAGTAKVGGIAVEPVVAGDGVSTPQTLTWSGIDIPEGSTIAVTYDVRVLNSVVANQTLTNSVTARWTSLNGTNAAERNGTGTPAYNDYFATDTTSLTTPPDATTLDKARLTDTYNAADANLRVGDLVDFELRIGLQEGSHTGLVLKDTLPAGMVFGNVVSADYFGTAQTPAPAPTVSGQTLTWNLGNVVNATADNDPTNDYLVIVYRARVMNNDALAQQPVTQTLPNTATLDYTVGGTPAAQLTASQTVSVQQPLLAVSKTAAPAGGDNSIGAGEFITYTVDIANSGAAPAYDTVLVDTLPAGLRQGGVTTISISLVTAGTSLPVLAPAYDATTGVATWNFDNGTANTYTIPAGETLRVVYRITADANLATGLTLTNTAQATLYYSFDDEAIPANGAADEREVYGPTNTAQQTLTTPSPSAPLKVNTQDTATIGEQFTYRITVPATPVDATLYDVRILDDLNASAADMRFVSASVVSGGAWTLANTSGSNTNLVIEGTGGGIDIPAGGQAVIEITVELLNSSANNLGLAFNNSASYTYNQEDGNTAGQTAGGASSTASMVIVEPSVSVSKLVSPTTQPTAGDVLTYTVNLAAATGANYSGAFDTGVVDTLSLGLGYVAGTAKVGGIAVEPVVAGDGVSTPQTLTWSGIDIPEGSTIAVTYDVRVLNSVVANQTLTNSVTARWTSLNGTNAAERNGTGTPAYNDYFATDTTSLTTPPDATTLDKARLTDTYNAADANLRVGDLVDFELRIGLQEGSHTGLVLKDTLPAGMVFGNVVSADYFGTAQTPAPAPTVSGQTLTWNLGNVVNATADNDPTNDYLVIVYRARVMNNDALAQQPVTQTLPNTATLDYTVGGTPAAQLTASQTVSVQQPLLAVSKTAAPAGGDNSIGAGEFITYTVDIANSGAAPAYDTVLVDTLPAGLRQGGVTTISISLVTAGTSLPVLAPAYDATTGVATWNFDNGTANTYTIPAGETLRVVYAVKADADVSGALTLTNAAVATLYYSFDDEAIPTNGAVDEREVYGPTNTATATLSTPAPALAKANTQTTAGVGEQFKYRITVPATPVDATLYDVRILDDLNASAADMRFVSASVVSGGAWTLANTSGSNTNLVIEGTGGGIDIPAGGQAVIEITVELLNTSTNVLGLTFTNTADYTYSQVDNTPASRAAGQPGTTAPMQIVGLVAQKTVAIDPDNDNGTKGILDAGDGLIYTITVNNPGTVPVTNVVLTDDLPANTAYVADSVMLNGAPVGQPDGGTLPLASGVAINSAGSVSGTIAANGSAFVTFKVTVNGSVTSGTVISNQGFVSSNQPTLPTDADGDASNGYQPTTIVVGSNQQVAITKEVSVVGGGAALPGSVLEYVVRVSNIGTVDATNVQLTDDLASLASQAIYVTGSATLDAGTLVVGAGNNPILTANVGTLLPGATATLRFRVTVVNPLATGTRLANTATATWGTAQPVSASAAIDVGGIVGSATLSGHAWHDANFDNLYDTGEQNLSGWAVGLYRSGVQVGSTVTDANGLYSFIGIEPTLTTTGRYELRFTAPGAGLNTAKLGKADSSRSTLAALADPTARPVDGMQQISNIDVASGSNAQNLNLPIDPNGAVLSSISRTPIPGATVTLLHNGTPVASSCFSDPAQQNQVTLASGFYKFDLTYSDASCPLGGDYLISVTPPAGYTAGPSRLIPPVTHETTPAYDVALCSADAVPTTAGYCEAYVSEVAPGIAVPASQINHYLHLRLSNPEAIHNQAYNNYLFVDAPLAESVSIRKTASVTNVSRGQFVPYTITVTNTTLGSLAALQIVDTFPPGFKYVEGSARSNGLATEPARTNRTLTWDIPSLAAGEKLEIKLLFIVSSGVGEGEYVNRAQMFSSALGASGEASATVRVIPDATFDCTDVIGKVFDDANRNGYQDPGEKGLPNVRVATARGLLVTSDDHGRFHITCAVVPNEDRGSNFILKLDDRSLPTGYRITTENPRVQRATRGKMMKFNFGAALNKIVRIDVANGVFEPGTIEMRIQWKPRMDLLMGELKKAPSILRLAYMAEVEDEKLVEARLKALKQEIAARWSQQNGPYELLIETEVFWRTGAPPSRSALK
ncbi:MAG: isopeptide-forming domain-containing fimbrial protein [Thiobacillus sp.]|uniref:isopeptide-forming domain-containing fimbrial protein n=1 Tax=Thiobacillus sp. TaxID=924 RepID=UPI00289554B3|nr:isopeptide-forming domain-containing fimbrial protein [Thiobacillus sp.]MDT3706704.1 isopeptide-forming domain-containing fimbrial protein [Thiobacillus sp.]